MPSVLLIAAYMLFAIALYAVYIIYYQYTYWKYRKMLHLKLVPILGNNADLFLRKESFPTHAQNLYNHFPKAQYYGMFDIQRPTVVLKDPEIIREVCIKSFDNFMDHEAFVSEEMDPVTGRNVFSLRGQRWKDVRSMLSPSYTAVRMKLLFELITECAKEFIQYFIEHPEEAKSFECKDAFTRYTNDVIATSAFGVKVNSMKNQDNEFFIHGKAASTLWIIKIIVMQSFPKLMRWIGVTFLPSKTDHFFKQLIINTVKLRQENNIVRSDMLQLLIQALNNNQVTMDDIFGNSFIFFLAGFETSSSLMSFLIQELAANPDVQDKLQREIDQCYQVDSEITYESLAEMKYLDMVINEALRLFPPVPMTNRICTKNCILPPPMEGYSECCVEKGSIILIPIFGFHRDPKYFSEPEKFIPERFSDENKYKITPYTYMPFGLGPRKCIGYRFALMETKIVIVHILKKFVVKFTEKTKYPVEFTKKSFSLGAEDGIWVKFEERKKSN